MIIPAQKGFYVIYKEGKELFVGKTPVIAWLLDDAHYVMPITTDGLEDHCAGYLNPNGSVSILEDSYDSLEEAKKAISE
jgi:hypothetical protein